jgi:hypothetical protein
LQQRRDMRRLSYLLLLLAGCDIPTELPKWNPTFAVPLEGTSFSVAQLLPSSIALAGGNPQFALSVAPVNAVFTLAQLCSACAGAVGQSLPKPAFVGTARVPVPLPADVDEASVSSGNVAFTVRNGFSFDPLRPSASARGTLTINVRRANGALLGSRSISGIDRALSPGSTLSDEVSFAGIADSLIVEVVLDSPAGDATPFNAADALTITVAPTAVILSSARLLIAGRQISAPQIQLNLTGIDAFVIRRVRGGKLVLSIENGFGASGSVTLGIAGGLTPITKTIALSAADTTVEVPLTESELEGTLGRAVVVSISGTVGANGAVQLTPTSAFTVQPLLMLELGPDQ